MRQFVRIIEYCLLVSMMLCSSVTWARYNISFPTTSWYSPTGNTTLTTSNYYDYYSSLYSQGHGIEHAGVDVIADLNSSVYAIGNGTVLEVRRKSSSTENESVITIEHKTSTGKRFCAIYGHVYSSLAEGSKVSKAQYIGQVKRYGSPDHIHFGINTSINSNVCQKAERWGVLSKGKNPGNYGFVDPFDWLKKNPATSSSLTTSQMVEYVFDELEDNYSNYFSPHQQTFSYGNDYYRSYPNGSWLYLYQGTLWYNVYGYGWKNTNSSIQQWYDSLR